MLHTIDKIIGPDGLSIWVVGLSIDINWAAGMLHNDWEIFDTELAALLYIDIVYLFT